MLDIYKNGQASLIHRVKILNSSLTTGAGLTGLTSASTGLIISTIASNEATATAYTVTGSTIETITTLGTYAAPTATKCRFKEVDATNHPGLYELQFADARYAVANAKSLTVSLSGATNLAQTDFVVQLVTDDPYVAKPTNSNLLSIDANGRIDASKLAGQTITAAAGVTFPTSIASPTNITAGTITTTTNLTNLPAITAGWLTAAGIAASALDGKGNWNIGKTGYSLTQTFPANFADMSISLTTGLVDITQTAADKTWATAARVLTAGTNIALAKGVGLTGLNDIAATDIVSAGPITTLTGAIVNVDTVDTCTTNTDMRGTDSANTTTPPTALAIADQVWDEVLSGHLTAGTTGAGLNAASSAGDPWATAIPGAYGAGTAGKILGDNIDAPISGVPTTAEFEARTLLAASYGDATTLATVSTAVVTTIPSLLPAALIGGRMDSTMTAIKGVTDTADRLERGLKGNVLCTVGAASSATSIVTSACDPAGVNANQFQGKIVTFAKDTTTTALRGQSTDITASTAAALPVLTVSTMVASPVSGDQFVIT